MPKLKARGTGARRARLFTTRMEMLISILSEKGVSIVPGKSPATDGKVIYMPWLKDDATEEDFLKFFCSAAHEQSHFHGKSRVEEMPKKKLKHFCVNAVDDIRCERIQEEAYPGLIGYRKSEYKIDCEGFLKEEFEAASKENMQGLVIAMLKYMIVKVRIDQLEASEDTPVPASEDLKEYYAKYLEDTEGTLNEIESFDESLDIGEVLYKRIRDLITDEMTPPEPEGSGEGEGKPSKEKSDEESKDSEGSDSSSEGDESKDEPEEGEEGEGGSAGSDEGEDEDKGSSELSDDEKAEIEKKVDEIMAGMDDAGEGYKTIADKYRDDVAEIADKDDSYKVANGVRDRVYYQSPNTLKGFDTLKGGKRILGSIGARMTKLFVAQTRERNLFNQRKGRFDMKSFIADPMDKRMDVYSKIIPGSLDRAAVSFAVDNSGSMAAGERIEKAYEILSGLLYYLDKAGVPAEAIGFTANITGSSWYRDGAVRHTIIKTFDESFNKKAISRCYPPSDLEQNVELEALRYLAPRLYQRSEGKKILFVLSDGAPCFGPETMNRKMAIAYKQYINKLRELGMYVTGFGIDCSVSEYFGEHSINTHTDKLGEEIVKKLTEILNRR